MTSTTVPSTPTPTTETEAPAVPRFVWLLQIVAAVLLGQTLFFKFTGAPESVAIFEALGAEPWGRYASGVAELIAVVMLLTPRLAGLGGLLGAGIMLGAIGSHLGPLGIEVAGDGGTLFGMAIVVLLASVGVAWLRRRQLPWIGDSGPN